MVSPNRKIGILSDKSNLWHDLVEAIRGTRRDLTEVPPRRAVVLLAVPMALESLLSTLFVFCDTFFIGQLGSAALAGVGIAEAVQSIAYVVAQALAFGTLAIVSRRIGEKDPDAAARLAVQSIGIAALAGIAIGIPGVIYADDLLRLMGAREDVVAAGTGYAVHLFGGSITVILMITINSALRGAGASAITLRVLGVAHAINLVLDPLLIFGLGPVPAFGVMGAAIATNTGRAAAIAFQLYYLTRNDSRLRIRWQHLRPDPDGLRGLARIAGTGFVQSFLFVMAPAALMRLLAPFPAAAVAGYTVALRITMFVMKPVWGVVSAAGILVGQNLGAQRPDRAEEAVWVVTRFNLAILGGIAACWALAAPAIIQFFTPGADAVAYGAECLRFMAAGYLFAAFHLVLRVAFNSAGDTFTPTWITLVGDWGAKIALGWLLAWPLGWGPTGIFAAGLIADVVMAAIFVLLFRRGRWKEAAV